MATIMNVVRDGQRLSATEPVTPSLRSPTEPGFPHSLFSSIPVAIPKVVEALRESSGVGRTNHPATPPSTPAEGGFCPDVPVQFDLLAMSSTRISEEDMQQRDAGQRRVNPFNQVKTEDEDQGATTASGNVSTFSASFVVRLLGWQEVALDRGEHLVRETIRQVMAARALNNVFKMSELQLVVSDNALRLFDHVTGAQRLEVSLEHISYWAVHSENKRLFGFITRNATAKEAKFICYVFECNSSGDEICHTLSTATQLAFQAFMQRKAVEMEAVKETELLLANIQQFNGEPVAPQLSADGKYVLLEYDHPQPEANAAEAVDSIATVDAAGQPDMVVPPTNTAATSESDA
jgi:DCC-interacting protein 13 alpha